MFEVKGRRRDGHLDAKGAGHKTVGCQPTKHLYSISEACRAHSALW